MKQERKMSVLMAAVLCTVGTAGIAKTAMAEEKPVKLTVEVYDRGNMPESYGDPIDNKWSRMVHDIVLEELNIDIEFMAIPRSEDTTKVQALMAAGNEPDIFYIYDTNTFLSWAGADALADLTDLMDTDGAQLKELQGEELLSYGIVDGKQYAIPARRNDISMMSSFIRKDWLDEVGIEVEIRNGHASMTPSELKNALIKIKEAGLCEYPMGLLDKFTSIQPIEGAFISEEVSTTDEGKATVINDFFLTADGDKEAFRFLNECYNSGLINPDFALFSSDDMGEKIAAGQCGFWSGTYWDYLGKDSNLAALYDADSDAQVIAIEICKEDGSPAAYETYMPSAAYCMVSSGCEDVGAALRFITWLAGDEAHLLICHGVEGEHWEYGEDGVIEEIDPEYNNNDRISVADLDVMINNDPCIRGENGDAVFRKSQERSRDSRNVDLAIEAKAIGESKGKWAPLYIDKQLTAISDYAAELKENGDNLIINSITAPEGEFDTVYDEYLQTYLEEGGQQAVDERLEALR